MLLLSDPACRFLLRRIFSLAIFCRLFSSSFVNEVVSSTLNQAFFVLSCAWIIKFNVTFVKIVIDFNDTTFAAAFNKVFFYF